MNMDRPMLPSQPNPPLPDICWSRKTGDKFKVVARYGDFMKVRPYKGKTPVTVHKNQITYRKPT